MSIIDVVKQFFEEEEWPFNQLEGEMVLHTAVQGENGSWDCFTQIREDQQQLIFYSTCPVIVLKDRRHAVMAFITRVNYGMAIGNFEMDLDDGEVRYKTSVDVENAHFSVPLMQSLVYTNVLTMDEYLPGIQAVAEAGVPPNEAIERIEGQKPS